MLLDNKIALHYFFGKAWNEVFLVTTFSGITYGLSLVLKLPVIPIAIPTFLGTAISLVLAFKLSQSYDRWWEARKVWGAIVNDSRTLVVQAKSFTTENTEELNPIVKRMAFRQMGWNYCLGQTLRKLDPLENLKPFCSSEELSNLENQVNKPLAMLDMQSKCISKLHNNGLINDYQQMQLDRTIVRLTTSMGQAERIKNTVFPTSYRVYLHVFIYLFLMLMSVSVAEIEGIWQIVVLTLISIPFMFLEKTAYHLQNPFENMPTDTPVTSIARTIEINLRQLIKDEDIPDPYNPNDFYLM